MRHICVSRIINIGSDNGLLLGRRQATIWTNVGILLIRTLGTNFSAILSEIHTFSFEKMHLKMASAKWRPFCLGPDALIVIYRGLVLISHTCNLCKWLAQTCNLCKWLAQSCNLCKWLAQTCNLCKWLAQTCNLCKWLAQNNQWSDSNLETSDYKRITNGIHVPLLPQQVHAYLHDLGESLSSITPPSSLLMSVSKSTSKVSLPGEREESAEFGRGLRTGSRCSFVWTGSAFKFVFIFFASGSPMSSSSFGCSSPSCCGSENALGLGVLVGRCPSRGSGLGWGWVGWMDEGCPLCPQSRYWWTWWSWWSWATTTRGEYWKVQEDGSE